MPNKKPKILFLIAEDWYFLSHRLPIAQACKQEGMDVIIATRFETGRAEIESEGFIPQQIKMRRGRRGIGSEISGILDLIKIYHRHKPDIVHHVGFKPVLYGSLAAIVSRVPSIVNAVAGLGYIFLAGNWRAKILRGTIKIALRFVLNRKHNWLILQNDDDANLFLETGMIQPDHLRLIRGSGVNTDQFVPGPKSDGVPIVVMVSRMLKDKGIRELIWAIRELKSRGVKLRVQLVGKPDPENPSSIPESQLEQWQEEGCVEWIGFQSRISEIYKKADIAVLPSYREGVPKSLLEAASCGLPIVTTNVPGCRDVVEDGVNGLLVPRDEWIELADALQKLVESPDLRASMAVQARRKIKQDFDVKYVVAETMSLYRHILSGEPVEAQSVSENVGA